MKIKKILGIILLLGIALVMTYKFVDIAPDKNLTTEQQVVKVLKFGQCAACHSHSPTLPFYANWPVIGDVIKQDAALAIREFDVNIVSEGILKNQPIDEVTLNKLEYSFSHETMPPLKYYAVHWGTTINRVEKEIMLNWIQQYRTEHHYNGLASTEFANEPVQVIPDSIPVDPAKVELGRMLYNDVRLSVDNSISCASCHDLSKGGTDNKPFSEGVGGQFGGINAPTVFNATFNFVQFWDGRAADLAAQAAGPPTNPIEMAHKSWRDIENILAADKTFAKTFTAVYPDGVTEANICNAIAEYEKTLITPNSPFDLYLKGNKEAMTAEQIKGYQLFKEKSCATCHAGVNLGGLSYEFMGTHKDYFAARGTELTEEDYGRGKQEEDVFFDHRFKTPGLRNVALTAPYFHDATQATLHDAVNAMAKHQTDYNLTDEETQMIVDYLNALTGDIPEK
ncbi:MAG: heme-binding domain-containing protein [Paludibacteraceae bacterium]|nr:heme-binding domain-containing protein [Paludibacteraceae bacterium]